LQRASPLGVLMVSSSSKAITADDECLACGEFSLSEPVHLGILQFITDYFGGLSLSPRRGNEGAIFVGSTRSGASTLQWATVEDSTKEFLTASSGEGSFNHSPPDGTTRRPRSPPLQLQRGRRALQPRHVFPSGWWCRGWKLPPLRAASHSPRMTTDASPCSASHR
jgi:hypothetical protein